MERVAIATVLSAALLAPACGGDKQQGPLEEVNAIVFIERQPREGGMGDIFQYESYVAGAKLQKLSPPTADGELTTLCCDEQGAEFEGMDIIDFDVSFDAKTIVFSGRLSGDQSYGLFVLHLDSGEVEQLPTDPMHDYVYPTILPGGRVLFATNAVVEETAPQFRDEYERGTTLQMGSIGIDGSDMKLYSRNLSHRITSSVAHDGTVILTQWDHLQDMNAGHLIRMNPDGTRAQEVFGKEGTGVTNSYYKALEAAPGRVIAIASSRDMTYQSGTILDIRLGNEHEVQGESGTEIHADEDMSEANASYRILTPSVPLMDEPSSQSVGRYYNAYPLNAKQYPDLLVSWADGPVQSDVNGAAGVPPDFGIYLYDSEKQTRRPIYDKEGTWEINPTPLAPREAPPVVPSAGGHQFGDESVLMAAMDVYESSITTFEPDSVYGVRIIEGFSSEEGIPNDFGLTEAEGAASLGVAEVRSDGSWAALVPANVPVHQQAIDHYGVALQNEPIWVSGNPGESMVCGGCHESRGDSSTVIDPGLTEAIAVGPDDLMSDVARFDRVTSDYTRDGTVGVPWDQALQPIFDAKCVSCHDGTPGEANPSYEICDTETGDCQTITFDLRGVEPSYDFGEMMSGYTASHLSLLGPDMMELEENGFEVRGEMKVYVEPSDARGSELIKKLNPMRQFPQQDPGDRLFDSTPHMQAVGGTALTPDEMYLMVLMADMGGQFYSRENAPGVVGY